MPGGRPAREHLAITRSSCRRAFEPAIAPAERAELGLPRAGERARLGIAARHDRGPACSASLMLGMPAARSSAACPVVCPKTGPGISGRARAPSRSQLWKPLASTTAHRRRTRCTVPGPGRPGDRGPGPGPAARQDPPPPGRGARRRRPWRPCSRRRRLRRRPGRGRSRPLRPARAGTTAGTSGRRPLEGALGQHAGEIEDASSRGRIDLPG